MDNSIYNTYRPTGFGTIFPYIMVENAEGLIRFLKDAFYAEKLHVTMNPTTGRIANCIMRIGETNFMISPARDKDAGMRTSFYLYTEEPDALYKRALEHGATSEFEPTDMPYGDRQGGIIDPSGNYWWISKRIDRCDY